MGQKTNPIGLRLGIVKTWDSRWFAKRGYAEMLKEDLLIKRYLKKRLYQAGISKITIERKGEKVTIASPTSRPGLVGGRSGRQAAGPGLVDGPGGDRARAAALQLRRVHPQ